MALLEGRYATWRYGQRALLEGCYATWWYGQMALLQGRYATWWYGQMALLEGRYATWWYRQMALLAEVCHGNRGGSLTPASGGCTTAQVLIQFSICI